MRRCAWCGSEFEGLSRTQLYCSDDCRAFAKEESTRKRYEQERRERRRKANKCCINCGVKLSMYGDGNVCSRCLNPKVIKTTLNEIRKLGYEIRDD